MALAAILTTFGTRLHAVKPGRGAGPQAREASGAAAICMAPAEDRESLLATVAAAWSPTVCTHRMFVPCSVGVEPGDVAPAAADGKHFGGG